MEHAFHCFFGASLFQISRTLVFFSAYLAVTSIAIIVTASKLVEVGAL